jgi:hypothetical protein
MSGPSRALAAARRHAVAFLLAAVAAAVAWAAHRWMYPALSWNRDEPVYLWQVDVLRAGQLTATDGGHPDLFHPWLSAHRDGSFFTQYTLGWPVVLLAARLVTGSAAAALPLGAALAVLGTYAIGWELTRRRTVAAVAGALLVASPLLAVQGGVHLSYLFTLGLGLLFGAALLSGLRTGARWRLVAAGLLVGWIFLTRPYDAVLWGVAFGGYAVVVHRARWRTIVAPLALAVGSAVPLLVVTLAYNRHVTGSWLQFPITAADPLDTFGFGTRRLMPTFEPVDYDLGKALRGTAKNAFFLPWFLAGSYVGLALAGWALWRRRRRLPMLALVLVMAVFPLGYLVFWGTWLSSLAARISGPIYLIPLFGPLCVLMALALVDLARERRRWAVVAGLALVLATVPFAVSRTAVNHEISRQQEPWRDSVGDLEGEALVIVADTAPYLLYLNPYSANSPSLDDRILYAADRDPHVLDLIAEQPERRPYLQVASVPNPEVGPREDPQDLHVGLHPVTVVRGPGLDLVVEVPAVEPTGVTTVELQVGGRQEIVVVDPARRLPIRFSIGTGDLEEHGTAAVILGHGEDEADARRHPVARHEVLLRRTGATLEGLTPTSTYRYLRVGDEHQWRRTDELPELSVTVRGA